MTDPIDGLEQYLETTTNIPHVLVLVLAFALVIALSHGTIAAGRYAVRKKKSSLILALLAAYGFATFLWADSTFGLLILLGVLLYALRKPITALFRRKSKKTKETDA